MRTVGPQLSINGSAWGVMIALPMPQHRKPLHDALYKPDKRTIPDFATTLQSSRFT